MSALKDWMDTWPLPEGEPFPGETIRADGWVYHDLPKMPADLLDEFVAIAGADNIRWLTKADYGNGLKRGQIFISPIGVAQLHAHAKAHPIPPSGEGVES